LKKQTKSKQHLNQQLVSKYIKREYGIFNEDEKRNIDFVCFLPFTNSPVVLFWMAVCVETPVFYTLNQEDS